MLIFLTIALVGFVYVLLTSTLGHFTHEATTDGGHDGGHENGTIISIFSPRVIAMFMMGFGGAGGVAYFYQWGYPWSSAIGLGCGLLMGAMMFYLLDFFARQQCNSLVATQDLIGQAGTVEVAIGANQPGEVAVSYAGRYATYLARAKGGKTVNRGCKVTIVETVGSDLIVEEV